MFPFCITKCPVPAASGYLLSYISTGRLEGTVHSANLTGQLYGYSTVHQKTQNSCSLSHSHIKNPFVLQYFRTMIDRAMNDVELIFVMQLYTNRTLRTAFFSLCRTNPALGQMLYLSSLQKGWRCRCLAWRFASRYFYFVYIVDNRTTLFGGEGCSTTYKFYLPIYSCHLYLFSLLFSFSFSRPASFLICQSTLPLPFPLSCVHSVISRSCAASVFCQAAQGL